MAFVEEVVKLEQGAWVEQPTVLQAAAMWEKVEAKFERRGGGREGQLAWTTLVNYWRPRRGELVPVSGGSGTDESKERSRSRNALASARGPLLPRKSLNFKASCPSFSSIGKI